MKRGPKTNIKKLGHKPKRAKSITYDDFIEACEAGNIEVVEKGIESLTVKVIASNGNCALWRAARNGHLAVVNCLLEIDAVSENVAALDSQALRLAASNGHLAVVNRLLEVEDTVEVTMVWFFTRNALWSAARQGHLELIKDYLELIKVKANKPHLIYHEFKEAVDIAARYGHLAIVKFLLEDDKIKSRQIPNNSALCHAAGFGQLEVVNFLLDIDAVRKHATAQNNCALLWAAKNGHLAVVKRLLQIPAVREAAAPEINETQNHSNQNGFMYNTLNSILTPLVGMAKKLVFGDPQNEEIETVLKKLAEQYPNLKISIDKENRKNEARALYFAFRASQRKPASQSVLKQCGQRDTVVKIMKMVLSSPPPAQQLDEPLTKKLR